MCIQRHRTTQHHCRIEPCQRASLTQPIRYLQIVWAEMVGRCVSSDTPSLRTIRGGLLTVGEGLLPLISNREPTVVYGRGSHWLSATQSRSPNSPARGSRNGPERRPEEMVDLATLADADPDDDSSGISASSGTDRMKSMIESNQPRNQPESHMAFPSGMPKSAPRKRPARLGRALRSIYDEIARHWTSQALTA